MLTRPQMLTIKNGAGSCLVRRCPRVSSSRLRPFVIILSLALLSGCNPAGPHALLEGKRLIDQGKYPQAIQKLQSATSLLGGTNALAWEYLGVAYQHAGEDSEAERAYQRALGLDHDLGEIHFNLGCLRLARNKLDAAKAEFTVYTSLRPNAADGFLKLGSTQLRSRDASGAEKSFTEALRLSPRNPEALNGLGLARLQRGRPAEAAECFTKALERQPRYPPALLNLAIVAQLYLKDRQLALQKYRECLVLTPVPANAVALAALVRQLEQELKPPAGQGPIDAVARPSLGATAVRPAATNATRMPSVPKPDPVTLGPGPDATYAPRSGAAPPPIKTASSANADVVNLPADPGLKRAEDVPTSAVPSGPSPKVSSRRYTYQFPSQPTPGNRPDAERSFAQAEQAYQAHRLSEAMQDYRLSVRQDPSLFQAQYNLGVVATEAGDLPFALTSYENALAIQPTSLDARYNFALVLVQANYLADAVNELEKLLARDPRETRAHVALGNIYAQQLQQPAKARQHFLMVLELEPRHSRAAAIRNWLAANPP